LLSTLEDYPLVFLHSINILSTFQDYTRKYMGGFPEISKKPAAISLPQLQAYEHKCR
jgi:hypothetical protein